MMRYGCSLWFKVIEIGTNRKPICHFLTVFHCNYVPVLYCFRVTEIYSESKNCVFYRFMHPSLVWSNCRGGGFQGSPLAIALSGPRYESWCQKTTWLWKLRDPTVISFESIPSCDGQTYRRTRCLCLSRVFRSLCIFLICAKFIQF